MTDFEKAKQKLKNASRLGSRLGLERIYELAALLGDPQDKSKTIHVAGTNGKGSFCAMLSSVLAAGGLRTGMFSSPVMLKENDCIRINGEPVSEEVFADAVIRAEQATDRMDDKPTEFELLTAVAFLIFAEQKCDFAVIECGMGGDGDSTNIIREPLLSVITNVTIDHCAFLGNTTAEIASHKAGIIKPGVPVYFGGDDRSAYEVISSRAATLSSELYTPDYSAFEPLDGDSIGVRFKGEQYRVPLYGSYQYKNLINALSCVEILRRKGVELDRDSLVHGLENVRWEGRFEKLSDDPTVIFDGAHNRDGMESFCESIRRFYKNVKPALLIGVLADKDYRSYAEMLRPLIGRVFAVTPDNPRALSAECLSDCFEQQGLLAAPYPTVKEGFEAAYSFCQETDLPLLTAGSLYMYKDIVSEVRRIKTKCK